MSTLPHIIPHWWTRRQRLKNNALFALVRLGVGLAKVAPYALLLGIAYFIAPIGWVVAWKDRKRAVQQLAQSLPHLTHPGAAVFNMFVHFARLAAEWTKLDRFSVPGSPYLEFTNATQQVLRDALAEGRGVIFVAPHLGNWELLAQAAARHGFPCTTIAKETYDPRITALLDSFRTRAGVTSLWRGDPTIVLKIGRALRKNAIVGALIDQDTKVPSVFVPFFGRLASTPVVPAKLAISQKAAVVFGYAVREGARYRIHFERVPLQDDATALTADLTTRIEEVIRRFPEQWVWLHERWKRRPPNESA